MTRPTQPSLNQWLHGMLSRLESRAITYKNTQTKSWEHFTTFEYLQKIFFFFEQFKSIGMKKSTLVGLVSATRWEWAAIDIAVLSSHAILVPLYPNLTDADVLTILNHSGVEILIVENEKLMQQFLRIKSELIQNITVIQLDKINLDSDQISLDQIKDFIQISKEIQPEDPATIIYTSGTTGQPKGVLLQHQSLNSEINEAFSLFDITPDLTSLSFLPYAHVMGRIEHWGSCVYGYCLAFAESIDSLKNDLVEIKPDFLIAVPRIFEKVFAGIINKVETQAWKKKIFDHALEISKKIQYYRQTKQTPPLTLLAQYEILSRLIFGPIQKAFGGKLKFAISGGAPLSSDLRNFFSEVGIQIYEGYGLTETFAAITVNTESLYKTGTVGKPIGDVKIKFDTDGEILVQSKKILKEYYKNPEATKLAFTEDGYFRTGDIGEFTLDGFLKITDRKKDLLKTAGGKYVAPQKLEGLLKQEPSISQVLIVGDQRKFVAAIISVEQTHTEPGQLSERIKSHILKVNSILASYESIKKFEIIFEAWTIESGELTPSMKVKRKFLEKKYSEIIDKMYT